MPTGTARNKADSSSTSPLVGVVPVLVKVLTDVGLGLLAVAVVGVAVLAVVAVLDCTGQPLVLSHLLVILFQVKFQLQPEPFLDPIAFAVRRQQHRQKLPVHSPSGSTLITSWPQYCEK